MNAVPSLTFNDQLAAELRAIAGRKNLSSPAVGRNAELPPMYVHRRMNGLATISVEDLVVLCRGLEVDALDVLAQVLERTTPPEGATPAAVAGI